MDNWCYSKNKFCWKSRVLVNVARNLFCQRKILKIKQSCRYFILFFPEVFLFIFIFIPHKWDKLFVFLSPPTYRIFFKSIRTRIFPNNIHPLLLLSIPSAVSFYSFLHLSSWLSRYHLSSFSMSKLCQSVLWYSPPPSRLCLLLLNFLLYIYLFLILFNLVTPQFHLTNFIFVTTFFFLFYLIFNTLIHTSIYGLITVL